MSKQLLLYAPVVHRGIEEFVGRHRDAVEVEIIGLSFQADYPWMKKDVRAVDPHAILVDLASRFRTVNFRIVETSVLTARIFADVLVLPDDDLSRSLVENYRLDLPGRRVIFESAWLRWDRTAALAAETVSPDEVVSSDQFDQETMHAAIELSTRSSDWWRQVGAIVVRGQTVLSTANNRHIPTEYTPYIDGDPRGMFHRGEHLELTTAIHAEAACIAWCARHGLATLEAAIYVTTFPCPVCARLIAASGISSCYYRSGYAVLDGVKVLRDAGVSLIRVQ